MAMLESMVTALSSYHPEVGIYSDDPTADHCVLVPVIDWPENADNNDYLMYSTVNAEFYISGDYRTKIATARTALRNAGLFVGDGEYVEYLTDTKKHHYFLPVTGRA